MKRLGSVLVSVMLVVGLAGCRDEDTSTRDVYATDDGMPNTPTSIPPTDTASADDYMGFENVTASFSVTEEYVYSGTIRNNGTMTKVFGVKAYIRDGDVVFDDYDVAVLAGTTLAPGMATSFSGSFKNEGHSKGTITYWGLASGAPGGEHTIDVTGNPSPMPPPGPPAKPGTGPYAFEGVTVTKPSDTFYFQGTVRNTSTDPKVCPTVEFEIVDGGVTLFLGGEPTCSDEIESGDNVAFYHSLNAPGHSAAVYTYWLAYPDSPRTQYTYTFPPP